MTEDCPKFSRWPQKYSLWNMTTHISNFEANFTFKVDLVKNQLLVDLVFTHAYDSNLKTLKTEVVDKLECNY